MLSVSVFSARPVLTVNTGSRVSPEAWRHHSAKMTKKTMESLVRALVSKSSRVTEDFIHNTNAMSSLVLVEGDSCEFQSLVQVECE